MAVGGMPLKYVSTTAEEMEDYFNRRIVPFCNNNKSFRLLQRIGKGSFGEVFHGKYNDDAGLEVAMKRIILRDEFSKSFPISAFREIQMLQQLKHDNIMELVELFAIRVNILNPKTIFFLSIELCQHDLKGLLLNSDVLFNFGEIKQVIQQLLVGLQYIHGRKIMHRDIKPTNILFTKTGTLKIGDFGLSRSEILPEFDSMYNYTSRDVTLWYRSPELLLGDSNYDTHVDIWGVGCIMAEMWTRKPIMKGDSVMVQALKISDVCGSITPEVWPKVVDLQLFNNNTFPRGQKRMVVELIKPYVQDIYTWDLLDCLLLLDPGKRIDASSALNHSFFKSDPLPQSLFEMFSELPGTIRSYDYRNTI